MEFFTFHNPFVPGIPSDDQDDNLVSFDIIQGTQVAYTQFKLGKRSGNVWKGRVGYNYACWRERRTMNNNRPPENPELVTVGVMPVQYFVARVLEIPPGTPARPRADRPPLAAVENGAPDETDPKRAGDASQPCDT